MCSDALFQHTGDGNQDMQLLSMKVRPRAGCRTSSNARMNSRTKVSFRINTIRALAPGRYRQEDTAFRYLSAAAISKNLSAGSLANSDKTLCVSGLEGCSARSVVVVVVRLVVPLGDGLAACNP